MAFSFIVLILPVLVVANIRVQLSGRFKDVTSELNISYEGNNSGIITNTERNTFNLNQTVLKNAVSLLSGKYPDNVYLRSPTPWGDLYDSFHWKQVNRTLKPVKGIILGILTKPSVIRELILRNDRQISTSLDVGMTKEVENSVASSWKTGGQISIDEEISYGIQLELVEAGKEVFFSYNSPWGKNIRKPQTMKVGTTSRVEIILEPNQSAIAQLQATMVDIKIQLEYEASLSGEVAVNYANKHKNHHFISYDIVNCIEIVNLSNQKLSHEIIDIQFYIDSKIIVKDSTNNNTLMIVTI